MKKLRDLRKKRQLTLAQAATRSGLDLTQLSRIETGKRKPTLEACVALVKLYKPDLTMDELVKGAL